MLDGTEYFECTCHSYEHAVTFTLALDDDDPGIYLSVYMDNRRGFWRRLWYGLRYAFGYQSRYGAFGNWTLQIEDAARLRGLLDRLIERLSSGNDARLPALASRPGPIPSSDLNRNASPDNAAPYQMKPSEAATFTEVLKRKADNAEEVHGLPHLDTCALKYGQHRCTCGLL
jgi:hypothetical protein